MFTTAYFHCCVFQNLFTLLFLGIVESKDGEFATVNFMGKTGEKLFWPTKPDQKEITASEIFCVISEPPIPVSNRHFKLKRFSDIDKRVKDLKIKENEKCFLFILMVYIVKEKAFVYNKTVLFKKISTPLLLPQLCYQQN